MTLAVPAWPKKPGVEEERLLPVWPMLWRGLALALLSLGTLRVAIGAARLPRWLALPVVASLAGVALLSVWAAAIHLTGGQKFDDHDWV